MTEMSGTIISWNNERSYGKATGADGKEYDMHHKNFIKKPKKLEIGEVVYFTPDFDSDRSKYIGRDVKHDNRPEIFKFVYFHNFQETLKELASLARQEIWGSRKDPNSLIILKSYLEHTFNRVKQEKKISITQNGEYASFNTGLGTKNEDDIYALVMKNDKEKSEYKFAKFCTAREIQRIAFNDLPKPANYFLKLSDNNARIPVDHYIYITEQEITPDIDHWYDHNLDRFPASYQSLSKVAFQERVDGPINSTKRRARRNFRAAVPQYYENEIQMLLPLVCNLDQPDEKTLAMVVAKEQVGYISKTILELEWAYKNARLIARPDRDDWLDF